VSAEGKQVTPYYTGKCHICKLEDRETLAYCPMCDHWFCLECRGRWFSRGLEWVKHMVGKKKPGCCGPTQPKEGEDGE
jgi:hypothetical protein